MSTTPSDATSPKPVWKPSPVGSTAFRRLEEILHARYMGWTEFHSMADEAKYSPRSMEVEEIEPLINELQADELARMLVRACTHGDVTIAKAIWTQRGPFETEYQEGARQILINGEVVREHTDAKHDLTNARSITEVAELMEWMPTVGLGFMCGVGTGTALLLQSYGLDVPVKHLAWKTSFTGELPVFSYGSVAQPELMLALDAKVRASHYADAFDHILCWVDEGTISEFPDEFDAFESIQELYVKRPVAGGDDEIRAVHVSKVTEEWLSDVSKRSIVDGQIVNSDEPWSYHALSLETFPVNPSVPQNKLVLGYQADEPLKHGFNHKPGLVLCRARVTFLREFNLGPVHQDNLAKAKEFVASYFPLDLMMLAVPQPARKLSSCVRLNMGIRQGTWDTPYLIRDFYKALGNDSPVQAHLQKSLTPPLLDYIRGLYSEVSLDAESMLALFQGLGVDNQGYRVDLGYQGLQLLHDAGFRFSDDSVIGSSMKTAPSGSIIQHRLNSQDTDVLLSINSSLDGAIVIRGTLEEKAVWNNRFTNALNMNLWPAETPKPESLLDALGKAGRKKKWGNSVPEMALLTYIDLAGLKACAEVAKTAPHWAFLKEHFGREAMTPFMRKIPAKVRGTILMDDIGL
jgi:hypothetical protein